MADTRTNINPGGASPPAAADLFLAAAADLAARRAWLASELWSRAAGPFGEGEVFARRDMHAVNVGLGRLAADPRAVLLLVALADRVAALEAAPPAKGGAA